VYPTEIVFDLHFRPPDPQSEVEVFSVVAKNVDNSRWRSAFGA
jgi:hypothetical protein